MRLSEEEDGALEREMCVETCGVAQGWSVSLRRDCRARHMCRAVRERLAELQRCGEKRRAFDAVRERVAEQVERGGGRDGKWLARRVRREAR